MDYTQQNIPINQQQQKEAFHTPYNYAMNHQPRNYFHENIFATPHYFYGNQVNQGVRQPQYNNEASTPQQLQAPETQNSNATGGAGYKTIRSGLDMLHDTSNYLADAIHKAPEDGKVEAALDGMGYFDKLIDTTGNYKDSKYNIATDLYNTLAQNESVNRYPDVLRAIKQYVDWHKAKTEYTQSNQDGLLSNVLTDVFALDGSSAMQGTADYFPNTYKYLDHYTKGSGVTAHDLQEQFEAFMPKGRFFPSTLATNDKDKERLELLRRIQTGDMRDPNISIEPKEESELGLHDPLGQYMKNIYLDTDRAEELNPQTMRSAWRPYMKNIVQGGLGNDLKEVFKEIVDSQYQKNDQEQDNPESEMQEDSNTDPTKSNSDATELSLPLGKKQENYNDAIERIQNDELRNILNRLGFLKKDEKAFIRTFSKIIEIAEDLREQGFASTNYKIAKEHFPLDLKEYEEDFLQIAKELYNTHGDKWGEVMEDIIGYAANPTLNPHLASFANSMISNIKEQAGNDLEEYFNHIDDLELEPNEKGYASVANLMKQNYKRMTPESLSEQIQEIQEATKLAKNEGGEKSVNQEIEEIKKIIDEYPVEELENLDLAQETDSLIEEFLNEEDHYKLKAKEKRLDELEGMLQQEFEKKLTAAAKSQQNEETQLSEEAIKQRESRLQEKAMMQLEQMSSVPSFSKMTAKLQGIKGVKDPKQIQKLLEDGVNDFFAGLTEKDIEDLKNTGSFSDDEIGEITEIAENNRQISELNDKIDELTDDIHQPEVLVDKALQEAKRKNAEKLVKNAESRKKVKELEEAEVEVQDINPIVEGLSDRWIKSPQEDFKQGYKKIGEQYIGKVPIYKYYKGPDKGSTFQAKPIDLEKATKKEIISYYTSNGRGGRKIGSSRPNPYKAQFKGIGGTTYHYTRDTHVIQQRHDYYDGSGMYSAPIGSQQFVDMATQTFDRLNQYENLGFSLLVDTTEISNKKEVLKRYYNQFHNNYVSTGDEFNHSSVIEMFDTIRDLDQDLEQYKKNLAEEKKNLNDLVVKNIEEAQKTIFALNTIFIVDDALFVHIPEDYQFKNPEIQDRVSKELDSPSSIDYGLGKLVLIDGMGAPEWLQKDGVSEELLSFQTPEEMGVSLGDIVLIKEELGLDATIDREKLKAFELDIANKNKEIAEAEKRIQEAIRKAMKKKKSFFGKALGLVAALGASFIGMPWLAPELMALGLGGAAADALALGIVAAGQTGAAGAAYEVVSDAI